MSRVSEYKNMYAAFQRAVSDLERSIAPDPFKYCDYDYNLEETIRELISDLKANEYRPKRVENFDLPKGEFAIRPGIIVDILDLTVIHRLLLDFIIRLDRKLYSGATAYRLKKNQKLQYIIDREHTYFVLPRYKREKIKIEEPWYNLWPEYIRNILTGLNSGKFKYAAKTDITAYFEDINLSTLGEILKRKEGKALNSINMIMEIFRSWSLRDPCNVRQDRGLPQGSSNVSGILSNYYLDIVDSYLESERRKGKIEWYRYCDDIHILCPTRGRAIAIILRIGTLLRKLGLNQNAEKTKILTSVQANSEIYNEIAENIKQIIESSQKKKSSRNAHIVKLRQEYKKIYRRKVFTKKLETALFITYNAARVLQASILKNRLMGDFVRFPVRAKTICSYARTFINHAPVFRTMGHCLHRHAFLYNLQIAYLVTVFRNLKRNDKLVIRNISWIAFKSKRHWYVRVQAIDTLFYLGCEGILESRVKQLLSRNNHRYVRRAALVLLPLCCAPEKTKNWLEEIARDLDVTVSRMANFLLSVINNKDFAANQLKKFSGLDHVFIGDQIWRLWYVAFNNHPDVRKSLNSFLKRMEREFNKNSLIKEHVKGIRDFILANP